MSDRKTWCADTEFWKVGDDDDCFKVALASRHSGYPLESRWIVRYLL